MTPVRTWAPASEMAMAEVVVYPGDAAGRRSTGRRAGSSTTSRIILNLRALPAWGLMFLILSMAAFQWPAWAADPEFNNATIPPGPLNFDTCARLAIQQSPYLLKSSVEIDIRRIDENDSRYTILPPVTFRSYYYVNRPQQTGLNPNPYILSFSTEPYNPLGSYFTLQAQKIATQMAIFAHLEVINEGLQRLGKMFLNLASLKQMASLQADLINLGKESLSYAENRQSLGTGTSLEVRVATQELELAKNEKERLESFRIRTLKSMKTFLGLKPEQDLEVDLKDARRQVGGSFDSVSATLEQAKARSYTLKALELRKEMQKYRILLAKAKILPTILFTTQTPDPLSVTTARGFYIGLGLEVPVWDGFKRIRDVSRQKAILRQFGAEKDVKEVDLTDKWNMLQDDLQNAAAALKIAQAKEELARLRERQGEIRFKSGGEPLPTWLEVRKTNIEAQKGVVSQALDYDEKLLNLRQLSGDLGYSYVDQKSWQK